MNKYLVVGLFVGLLFGISLHSVTGSNMIYTYGGASTTNNYYYGGNISMVGHNHTQDLNITSNVIFNNITADSGHFNYVDKTEISEPTVPGAGILRLFVADEGGFSKYFYKDEHGVVRSFNDDEIVVKNIRGSTIAKHRIVYVTGNDGGYPTVDLANASDISTMPSIGVTIESIANNSIGRVMQTGQLLNVNTNSYELGTIYVSDVTAGIPTNTPPVTPSLTQEIGTILVKDVAVGKIQIISRALTGDEFGTINNFTITENCTANFVTANSFFGDGGNLTNITASGDGYAGDQAHPHVGNDLNTTSDVVFNNIDGNIISMIIGDIADYISHTGDADTLMTFLADRIHFTAGGFNFLDIEEAATDELVVNEGSVDINFRVESNANTHALYVDSGLENVGIFDSTPDYDLDVGGDIGLDDDLFFTGTTNEIATDDIDGSDSSYVSISGGGDDSYTRGATIKLYGNEHASNGAMYLISGDGDIVFYSQNTVAMRIDTGTDHVGLYSETSPFFACEAINSDTADGKIRAFSFPTYSDKRSKFDFSGLGANKVLNLCRLINFRIYKNIETWQDETGAVHFGEVLNTYNVGIYAQDLYYELLAEFGENIASQIVHKPEDDSMDYWSVNYDAIQLIFCRGWQINDERISALEEAVFG